MFRVCGSYGWVAYGGLSAEVVGGGVFFRVSVSFEVKVGLFLFV